MAGFIAEALKMNIEAMDEAYKIVQFDRQTLGFDVETWLTAMRGQMLVMQGRIDEARPFLDRILALESGQIDILTHVIPSWAYVDLAWAEGNIALAQEHAERAYSLAVKSGNPYLRVYGQACRGISHVVARRFTSAIQDFSDALNFARSRRAGLEDEPRILADLANAYRLSGDHPAALATADEAIKVATDRHARIPECLARIVRADLLLRSPTSDQLAEGKQELVRARVQLKETGAVLFENFIDAMDADHSNAFQIYTKANREDRSV
jgi:adenylate cyclase